MRKAFCIVHNKQLIFLARILLHIINKKLSYKRKMNIGYLNNNENKQLEMYFKESTCLLSTRAVG